MDKNKFDLTVKPGLIEDEKTNIKKEGHFITGFLNIINGETNWAKSCMIK